MKTLHRPELSGIVVMVRGQCVVDRAVGRWVATADRPRSMDFNPGLVVGEGEESEPACASR